MVNLRSPEYSAKAAHPKTSHQQLRDPACYNELTQLSLVHDRWTVGAFTALTWLEPEIEENVTPSLGMAYMCFLCLDINASMRRAGF